MQLWRKELGFFFWEKYFLGRETEAWKEKQNLIKKSCGNIQNTDYLDKEKKAWCVFISGYIYYGVFHGVSIMKEAGKWLAYKMI